MWDFGRPQRSKYLIQGLGSGSRSETLAGVLRALWRPEVHPTFLPDRPRRRRPDRPAGIFARAGAVEEFAEGDSMTTAFERSVGNSAAGPIRCCEMGVVSSICSGEISTGPWG